jgi:hypothetical protein
MINCGSSSVLIDNLMAARQTDGSVHGGVIASGCPSVLIGEKFGSKVCLKEAAQSGAAFVKGV